MQGMGGRLAKGLNRWMAGKGRVFAGHNPSRILRSRTGVANALAYVLMNFLHPFPAEAGRYAEDVRDPFSSAWREQGKDPPVVQARSWLLTVGWRTRATPTLTVKITGLGT